MKRYFGVTGAATAWTLHRAIGDLARSLIVVPHEKDVQKLSRDLKTLSGRRNIYQLPARHALPFEAVTSELAVSSERMRFIETLLDGQDGVFIAGLPSLFQKLPPKTTFASRNLCLRKHSEHDRKALFKSFLQLGYLESSNVEEVGEVACRGGIIDFFPPGQPDPLRIEIVGGIIQNIRSFSAQSQRSLEHQIEHVVVLPVRERLQWKEIQACSELSEGELEEAFKRLAEEREAPLRESKEIWKAIHDDLNIPGIEMYQHILPLPWCTWPEIDIPTILIDELELFQEADRFEELIDERETRLREQHYLIPPREHLFLSAQEITSSFQARAVSSIGKVHVEAGEDNAEKVTSYSLAELTVRLSKGKKEGHHFQPLAALIDSWRKKGLRVAFTIGSEHRAKRLQRILLELDMEAQLLPDLSVTAWAQDYARIGVAILFGQLSQGIHLPDEGIVVVSESEIFGETSSSRKETPISVKKLLNSLSQLQPGDFVVHVDYGIGKYHGFTHRTVHGCGTDLLQIEYADSTLFLPMTNIAKIQRYSGVEGQTPKIDKLSSQKWQKTKAKVRRSVEVLAGDLVKLYAARKIAKGWRFDPSGAQDEEFADGFPFQETVDQLQAIEETLSDMASERPMDRLICGDVGFGKTEVALRAAYKATQHTKQVVLLCPTTILVEQHFQSFQNRLSEFPVEVGAVSRFYSAEQNKKTLERLRTGQLDIVIGTHKLLQRDIEFKDLGLLIIDEEHRFGVKQKERLKQFKKHVDVLTLTATPIPRTLHMSLLQLRDISIISTPPVDRRTVRTFVTQEDENTIRDAILRELQRGGQIFFVHNRVKSIDVISEKLRELVPEARIIYAHGQMSETQLEEIMVKFLRHEVDVLISTTIIESGIDIPNANTIIIDRADSFGLAQLYQLRGRVGRSNRQAYCYFLTPKKKRLSGEAQERLRALQSLDELGIGFQLAVRDLEIRGAGNLLGREQSGNVLSVGFELYTRILDEAIHHLSSEEIALETLIEPEVKIEVDAYIPEEYIPDVRERMVIYQRMSSLRSQEDALQLQDELEDRFGPLAPETLTLVDLMTFRGELKRFGVLKCDIGETKFSCVFSPQAPLSSEKAIELVQNEPKKYRLGANSSLTVQAKGLGEKAPHEVFKTILSILDDISASS